MCWVLTRRGGHTVDPMTVMITVAEAVKTFGEKTGKERGTMAGLSGYCHVDETGKRHQRSHTEDGWEIFVGDRTIERRSTRRGVESPSGICVGEQTQALFRVG